MIDRAQEPTTVGRLPVPADVEGLIFDCDGTLTDSMPAHYAAWRATLDRYHIPFPEAKFYSFAGVTSVRIVERLAAEHAATLDAERVAREKEDAFLAHLDQLKAHDDVVALARRWHGRPMAVASGGVRDVIDAQLARIGIEGLFEVIVTSEDTTEHKPDPAPFLLAAERIGVDPARCLVLEDGDPGIEAARRAKMRVLDVREFVGGGPAEAGAGRRSPD